MCYVIRHYARHTERHLRGRENSGVKAIGFLLMLSGWLLVLASIALLPKPSARMAFIFAGIGVELLGMFVAARAHLTTREEMR